MAQQQQQMQQLQVPPQMLQQQQQQASATYVRIGQYRLSKTLGIGSFGKVKRK